MKRQFLFTMCLILALAVLVPVSVTGRPFQAFGSLPAAPAEEVDAWKRGPIPNSYGRLPLAFEANLGQAPGEVEFLARGSGYSLFLTSGEAVLALRKPAATKRDQMALESPFAETGDAPAIEQVALSMQFIGANATPQMVGLEALPGKVNYLLGHDPATWRTNVSTYAKIEYRAVYPGVDLIYYGNQGQLEYDFVVAPGADPNVIMLGFAGVDKLELDAQGDLVMRIAGEQVRMRQPVLYQERDGIREPVGGGFQLLKTAGRTEVGFRVGAYDAGRPLVIDPVLVYSTFLGGSGEDLPNAIAVDAAGSAYITGFTTSSDFPVANALQPVCVCGDQDLFVTKFSPAGDALVYSTYLGGSRRDNGFDIAVDAAGNAYVSGWTQSADFPTVNPAQPAFGGGSVDAIVFKLNPSGSALLYSTFLGGTGTTEYGNAIAVDAAGSAYVAGVTDSPNFPTVTPLQVALSGAQDGYLARLDPAGSTLLYSTYLGGSGLESASDVALDTAGDVFVAGNTRSSDLPVMAALQPAWAGGIDGFVLKLNAASSTLLYATYLGGAGDDVPVAVAVDAGGAVHVAGYTSSPDFPVANALQPSLGGGRDIFAARLSPAGSGLVYSTYLGGGGDDLALDMALDSAGSLYLSGWTQSANLPIANAVQPIFGGGTHDSLALKLSADGSALAFSTFLGGGAEDRGTGIALDTAGAVYLTGLTFSTDFPTMNPLQPTHSGFRDAFVAKIMENQPPPQQATQNLIDQVQALVDVSTLNQGQGNALIAKLDGVIKQLEKGNTQTALNELQAFISQVNDFMNSTPPILLPAEGQPLIDAANAIIAALDG
jgi:hypothetical protein